MMLETALISLGKSTVQAALKVWLGGDSIATGAASSVVDTLANRLGSELDKRALRRLQDQVGDTVAKRMKPMLQNEFQELPDSDFAAAVLAVESAIEESDLEMSQLVSANFDAAFLDRHVRAKGLTCVETLSGDSQRVFDILLREACSYVIEISRELPAFGPNVLTEMLKRESEVVQGVREVLNRLPQRRSESDFSQEYRNQISRLLDEVELFGVSGSETSRRYPLSVAYITLTAIPDADLLGDATYSYKVESLLEQSRRLFIRGDAGLGKTTLLQWIAVRGARRDFPPPLEQWNSCLPIFVPLRRYAGRRLPGISELLAEVGPFLADEAPVDWVRKHLEDGEAVLLIDGVDELPLAQRSDARNWLRALVGTFPRARYVITTRPGATSVEWLRDVSFKMADLQPMSNADIREFVARWHTAVRSQSHDFAEWERLHSLEAGLLSQIIGNHHLRRLAGYPLLCALLCALNRDRRASLPGNRMEIYDLALQMLLERRDAERGIDSLEGLGRTEKSAVLSDLAYWLMRNNLSAIEVDLAVGQISKKLIHMPQIRADGPNVYNQLLERSGLLREQVPGVVDFVHRSFQEYLAARAAMLEFDDVGFLVSNAEFDSWHDTIVMAAGHGSRRQRDQLLGGIIERGRATDNVRVRLLAVACLETCSELSIDLRKAIEAEVVDLLPPRSAAAADVIAVAGPVILPLLTEAKPTTAREVAFTIRAASRTNDNDAINLIKLYAGDDRSSVQQEIIAAWARFPAEMYMNEVLSRSKITALSISDPSQVVNLRSLKDLRRLEVILPLGGHGDMSFAPDSLEYLSVMGWQGFEIRLDRLDCRRLKVLRVTRGRIGLVDLARFPDLTHLDLGSAQLTGSLASEGGIGKLRNLQVLRLGTVGRIAPTESSRAVASSVDCLDLVRVSIDSQVALGPRYHPTWLRLSNCTITSLAGLAPIAGRLTKLSLVECRVFDCGDWSAFRELTEIELVETLVDDEDLEKLATLPNLKRVRVDRNRTNSSLRRLALLPALEIIEISLGGSLNLQLLGKQDDLVIRIESSQQVSNENLMNPTCRVERVESLSQNDWFSL